MAEEIDKGATGAEQSEIDVGGYLHAPGHQIGGVDGMGVPLDEDGCDGVESDRQTEQ